MLLQDIFLKWLHLVEQDYFSGTPAHSRLNTEHRSDDLDEAVALSCNRSVFVSCKKCLVVRELLASQPPLNPWKDDGAPHSGGHLRPRG